MKIVSNNVHRAATVDMTQPATKATISFLSLPSELRNEIYELSGCLTSKQRRSIPKIDAKDLFTFSNEDILHACLSCAWPPGSLSLWVNRNSSLALKHGKDIQRLRNHQIRHSDIFATALKRGSHIEHGVEQPALTRVSKQVRSDTLPIFYGQHGFLFTLFDREIDGPSIFKYLRTIGKDSTALLRKVRIVVRNKADQKYAGNELIPELKRLGLKTDEGTDVQVVKLAYPYCYCESCIRKAIGETYRMW